MYSLCVSGDACHMPQVMGLSVHQIIQVGIRWLYQLSHFASPTYLFCMYFEIGSYCVAQANFRHTVLWLQLLGCWGYRNALLLWVETTINALGIKRWTSPGTAWLCPPIHYMLET